jgi:hypothetical protein
MEDELGLEIVGDIPLRSHTFACCDLVERTVRALDVRIGCPNCVVKEIDTHQGIAWVKIEGIVKLIFGKGNYRQPPFPPGMTYGVNEIGEAIWYDPMGDIPRVVSLSSVQKVGDIFLARLM